MSNYSVTEVAALAYSNVAKHIRYVALTGLVSTILNWPNAVQNVAKSGGFAPSTWSINGLVQNVGVLGTLVWLVLWALTTTAFAVNWHRHILNREPFEPIKFVWAKGPVLSYLWIGVLIFILCLLMALVTVLGASITIGLASYIVGTRLSFLGYIAGLVIGAYLLVLSVRMGISLVGKALGESFYGPISVLPYSKDMFWPIFGVIALVNIPTIVVTIIIELLTKGHALPFPALTVAALLNNWFGLTVNLSLLTMLYAVLVQKKSILNGALIDPVRVNNSNDFFAKWQRSVEAEKQDTQNPPLAVVLDSPRSKSVTKRKSAKSKKTIATSTAGKKKMVKATKSVKTKRST